MQVYNNRSDYRSIRVARCDAIDELQLGLPARCSPLRSDTIFAFVLWPLIHSLPLPKLFLHHPPLQSPHPAVCITRTNYFPFSKATLFARVFFWLDLWLVLSFRTLVDPELTQYLWPFQIHLGSSWEGPTCLYFCELMWSDIIRWSGFSITETSTLAVNFNVLLVCSRLHK